MTRKRGLTRREFAQSVGAGAAAATVATSCKTPNAPPDGRTVGPGAVPVVLQVNGKRRSLRIPPRTTLLEALRDSLELTGSKPVCDRGACGACTVLLDRQPVCSCML